MKVLLVVPSFHRSGPINGVLALSKALVTCGLVPDVLALSPAASESLEGSFAAIGLQVRTLGPRKLSVWSLPMLQAVIVNGGYDVVHTTGLRPDCLLGLLRLRGWDRPRMITTVRAELRDDLGFSLGRVGASLVLSVWKAMFKRFDAIVPHSTGTADALRSYGLPEGQLHVVYNGVDTEEFAVPSADAKLAARERLGIDSDRIVLGYVGNLIHRKAVDTILGAMAQLPPQVPIHFVSVGAGPEQGALREMAGRLSLTDRILWAGRQPDVRPYLAAMDGFVLPSWSEGLARALLEAAASGLPLISSDIPGCRDVVVPGLNGLTFPPGNAEALASAIQTLASSADYRLAMGKASRKRVEELFSSTSMARGYITLYQRLLSQRPS